MEAGVGDGGHEALHEAPGEAGEHGQEGPVETRGAGRRCRFAGRVLALTLTLTLTLTTGRVLGWGQARGTHHSAASRSWWRT